MNSKQHVEEAERRSEAILVAKRANCCEILRNSRTVNKNGKFLNVTKHKKVQLVSLAGLQKTRSTGGWLKNGILSMTS